MSVCVKDDKLCVVGLNVLVFSLLLSVTLEEHDGSQYTSLCWSLLRKKLGGELIWVSPDDTSQQAGTGWFR